MMSSNKFFIGVMWLFVIFNAIAILLMLYYGIKPKMTVIALIVNIIGVIIVTIINRE